MFDYFLEDEVDELLDTLTTINIDENDYPDFWHESPFIDISNPAHIL